MFINCSNHVSMKWPAEELQQANAIAGKIIDVQFPKITSSMNEERLAGIAHEVARDILGMIKASNDAENAAMVVGELNTSLAIIDELQKAGIPCIYGATDRVAVEFTDEEGNLHVDHVFKFMKFRPVRKLNLE